MKWFKPYLWRLVFILAGLLAAILFLTIGFGKTMLILLCCGAGAAVGIFRDKDIQMPKGWWKPYVWRISLGGLGLLSAVLFLTIGVGKTLVILILGGVGFVAGWFKDKGVTTNVHNWFSFWRDR